MTDNLKQFIILVKNNGNRIGEVLSSDEPYIQNRYLMPKFQEVFINKKSKKYKLPKQHYHNQNEVLLNQSLQTGKNIIYEITDSNADSVLGICDGASPNFTYFSFPGTKLYSQNSKYAYQYKIILLIPIEHLMVLMSMNKDLPTDLLSSSSVVPSNLEKIYKHLQYIIDTDCIDTLLLYSNDSSQPLTLIFDKKKMKDIPNIQLGGLIPDNPAYLIKGHIADRIYDATNDCYISLKNIYDNESEKNFFNLPGEINNTFSFFNMGISLVGHKNNSDYYIAAVRVIGCPSYDKEFAINQSNTEYINWKDKSLDRHRYVDYAGDIFNKWLSPFGYWNMELDITLFLLYKKTGDDMTVIDQSINHSLIDTRIFQTFATEHKYNILGLDNTISIISGSIKNDLLVEFGLDDHDNCIKIQENEEVGRKVGMSSITVVDNSFIHPISPEPKVIGVCLSKIPQTEKNYAMIYFSDINVERFNPNKGVLLHFHMSRIPDGNIFHFKQLDYSIEPNADLSFGWQKIIPPRSDIFMRLCNHYTDNTFSKERYDFGEISCSTPLNNITYFSGHTYITGVAHMKISIWRYLENYIAQLGTDGPLLLQQLTNDKIYRFYKHTILPWVKHYVWDSDENINKYTAVIDLDSEYWQSNPLPEYLTCVRLRQLLINDGFFKNINDKNGKQFPFIIRHLHPIYIYFMLIYRLNPNNLSIKDFSNPFIIMNRPESTFLNFPVGLTTNNDNIWISYGEGDCKSYIAWFSKNKIEELCKNTNETPIANIDFELHNHI
jgi:hypothetical protein